MYTPIIKSRKGEMIALSHLTEEVKSQVSPVVEVVPGGTNSANYVDRLKDIWVFQNNQVFIDPQIYLDVMSSSEEVRMADMVDIVIADLRNLRNNGVNAIPVVRLNSIPLYINSLIELKRAGMLDQICLRIPTDLIDRRVNANITAILNAFGFQPENVHLLFDFQNVNDENYMVKVNTTGFMLAALTDRERFQSIIIASGSFLKDLSELGANTITELRRVEEIVFNELLREEDLNGLIRYGDYCTRYPIYDPEGQAFSPSCSVKYTTTHGYRIHRGIKAGNHELGNGQFNEQSEVLVEDAEYDGPDFSWGDREIYEHANREELTDQPGNAGTWVAISVNRHITKIVHLLGLV